MIPIAPRLAALTTDLVLFTGGIIASPWLIYRLIRTGKIRTDWPGRFGKTGHIPGWRDRSMKTARKRILFNAVSVGEVNAIRKLVAALEHEFDIVIAVTTNTGFARASHIFRDSPSIVLRYPLDFSVAVSRFLNAVKPDLVILVELEVWPNFTLACSRRGIPIVIANGRLSARSFRRYRWFSAFIRPMFRRLTAVIAQDDAIADRFRALGVDSEHIHTLGTMKWDNATLDENVTGSDDLAQSFGIDRTRPIVVAGSTAAGEEALVHRAVPGDVQLIVAPRKPERFDEAVADLPGCVRRTDCRVESNTRPATRFLLDTIGELRAAYVLADVVIVGRSFGNMHGSDMIEPIALGKPTIVGPRTGDFESIMVVLRQADAVRQVDADQLRDAVHGLLNDENARRELAKRGLDCVRAHQGSVKRHADLIRSCLLNQSNPA